MTGDDRHRTRTMLIRDALVERYGDRRRMQLRKFPARGHAQTYYLREQDPGEPQAQYLMTIGDELLAIGLSIEKGEETSRAVEGRRMHRTWSWHQLRRASAEDLSCALHQVSVRIDGRPVRVRVETHEGEGDESARDAWEYVYSGGSYFERARPATDKEVVKRIRDLKKTRWADVWFAAEFGPAETRVMGPERAAEILFAFREMRDWLNGTEHARAG
jgi:hypothetical protein